MKNKIFKQNFVSLGSIRTDLAIENLDFAKGLQSQEIKGVEQKEEIKNGIKVTTVKILDEAAKNLLGKAIGEYITIEASDFKQFTPDFDLEVSTVSEILGCLIKKDIKSALIVGLGNKEITPDALGPCTIDYIFSTRHINKALQEQTGLLNLTPVCAIAPGVLGQTGIETAEIVKALVNEINPSCVIVIDALASKSVDRLATTIQISNTGISPGSGVQNSRKELSEKTLNIPVISIGVPMVVDMATVAVDILGEADLSKISKKASTMMVTPREIDVAIEHASKLLGFAINKALQPHMTLEELYSLVG